ncbi:uncharacterized protein LOC143286647 [Babylonia areolata]|uniref:uncharacterized protein LOC143286647 n=1 Tax=Babylonia areolata TaxID=304850 RepID=UPI003FD3A121
MSTAKGVNQERMFHIKYPARRDFWTWIELGCMARALGFPADLFRHNVNEEVETEEEGMYLQQLNRMIELKLLNQVLHRSFNMHTSDWNLCVIRKAVKFLALAAVSFEELHNIRVAYATYEASDMKGLALDQRNLLRTLKMCHRVISPKKLMHRVKHMKTRLEEANRIQLYEFLDLILWCDYMEHHRDAHHVGEAEGKNRDLYQLVDFESLLSHQDQRRSRALDKRYLAEEWDFGRERLGSKHMFKGEVVYTDQRIKQTRVQKKNYRGLKRAVSQSQRRVYRAHAGSIRQRPISAPDLSMYSSPRDTPRARTTSAAAMYHSVQRRLFSAASGRTNSRPKLSDRPALPEYVRAHTPSVVTSQDLDDVSLKMRMLQFDIITLETRCEVKKEEEMNFYIPEYEPPASEHNSDSTRKEGEKKTEHWTPEIVDKLAYPPYHLSACHALTCDARHRGWRPAEHKGRQRIITAPTFDNSPHGQLLARQRSAMLAPVTGLHKDYVVRYTSGQEATEQQKAKRPCTAPAMASPRVTKPLKRLGCRSAGNYFRKYDAEESTTTTTEDVTNDLLHPGEDATTTTTPPTTTNLRSSKAVDKSYPDPYGIYSQECSRNSRGSEVQAGDSRLAGSSFFSSTGVVGGLGESSKNSGVVDPSLKAGVGVGVGVGGGVVGGGGGKEEKSSSSQASTKGGVSRRHAGSKVVDVGLIGTITLLESIQEHETEDRLTNTLSSSSSSSSNSPSPSQPQQPPTNPTTPGRFQDNLDASFRSIPPGWSRHPETPPCNKESAAPDAISSQPWRMGDATSAVSSADGPALKKGESLGSDGGACRPVASESGYQTPKERVLHLSNKASPGVQSLQNHGQHVKHDPGTKVKGGPLPRPEQGQLWELRGKPRNKNQQVTSTRVNNNNNNGGGGCVNGDDQYDMTRGITPSPHGFKRSSPCITSTPRRKRASPTTSTTTTSATIKPPQGKLPVSVNADARKPGQRGINGSSQGTPTQGRGGEPTTRPDSVGKGEVLPKATLHHLLHSDPSPPHPLRWVQDQVHAMNSGGENRPQQEIGERLQLQETEGDRESYDHHLSNEDGTDPKEENKATIRFSKEAALQEEREAAHKEYLARRKASESALKVNDFDPNAEAKRRFVFNKATTRRLLGRVEDVISPELRARIKTGNAGLRVI